MVKLANDDPAAFAKLSKRIFAPNMQVCLYCRRLIYGKKDAGAGWRRTVIPELHAMGFRVTKHSECLLVMMKPSLDDLEKTQSQEFMTSDWTALKIRAEGVPAAKDLYDLAILIIQVDDLMWDGHSRLLIWIGDKLEKKFKLGEKGEAEHFNGAKMHFDGHRIGFSYPDQCTKMLNKHRAYFPNVGPNDLPGEPGKIYKPVTDEEFEEVKDKPFAELTGALVFISRTGQPWISVYVLVLACFMCKWGEETWRDLCHLGAVAYRDRNLISWFDGEADPRIKCFADASFHPTAARGCIVETYMGGVIDITSIRMPQKYLGATYWCELKITAVAAPKVEGLEGLKREIPGTGPHIIPILYGDNESAVGTINKPGRLSSLSRNIAKDIAVPRDMVARLVMIHMWIKTEYMLADIGTKFVSQTVYKALVPKMRGIEPIVPSFGTNFKKRPRVQFDGEVKTGI